jgi:O-antigen/teichoic acid export membrane protein
LGNTVMAGVGWSFLARAASEAARLLRLVVLARLLAPEDFGVMAIALVALGALEMFTEPGLQTALVQRRGEVGPYLDTAFTVQVVRGLLLAAALVALAPRVAAFFGSAAAAPVLQALAGMLVLRGLVNPATVRLTRELDFRRLFYWNLGELLASLAVAVALAVAWANVWALAGSMLAGQAVRTALSYRIVPERPRLRWEREKGRELVRFGRWVLGTNVLVFLALQGDNAFVGRFLGVGALGVYALAFRISELPRTFVTEVLGQVAFPLFARLQGDAEAARRAYFTFFRVLVLASGAVALALSLLAGPLAGALLGPKWDAVAAPLQILAWAGFVRSLTTLGSWLFYSFGRPRLSFAMTAARVLTMAATIYPFAAAWGLRGVSASVLLSMLAALPVYLRGITATLQVRFGEHLGPPRYQIPAGASLHSWSE